MAARYAFTLYPYTRVPAQSGPAERLPVVVVGGGPVGLATALDLGLRGTPVLLLDEAEGVGTGSRAICFSKRSLEIADRLGCVDAMRAKGVEWSVGRVFHGEQSLFDFNLSPETGHKHPAFINLQQPYFEKFLVEGIHRAQAKGAPIELRGGNRVAALTRHEGFTTLDVETPDGPYHIQTDWLIACDGARSPLRDMLGLGFDGRVFEDNFLIADVKMTAPFPTERWFWFAPPFDGAGQSALLHKQPDNLWRIDFQVGWDIDRKTELDPARIRSRVDAMLRKQTGEVPEYSLEWTSIYTFQCRRMDRFRHGRVLFAGDAAHQVSPFGARGANSGLQDAENLAWKLDLVVKGNAPDLLLDSYCAERVFAADENILNSSRATDFLTPKSDVSKIFRNAVLKLAQSHAFARPLVNSGRLSVPCTYDGLPLNGPDQLDGPPRSRPGATCPDAPLGDGFLLNQLGSGFTLLAINLDAPTNITLSGIQLHALAVSTRNDPTGALAARYLGTAQTAVYLIRPDHHITARWLRFDVDQVRAALRHCIGKA